MAQSTIVGQGKDSVKSTPSETEPKSRSHSRRPSARKKGLAIEQHFTRPDANPLDAMVWERRQSVITNPDGSVVFKMEGAEIPAQWSQLATDIVVSKYFRKAGIKQGALDGETSVRQVVTRVARTIRRAGEDFGGYFTYKKD